MEAQDKLEKAKYFQIACSLYAKERHKQRSEKEKGRIYKNKSAKMIVNEINSAHGLSLNEVLVRRKVRRFWMEDMQGKHRTNQSSCDKVCIEDSSHMNRQTSNCKKVDGISKPKKDNFRRAFL